MCRRNFILVRRISHIDQKYETNIVNPRVFEILIELIDNSSKFINASKLGGEEDIKN